MPCRHGVSPHFSRTLLRFGEFQFELSLIDQQPAFEADRLDRLERGRTAFSLKVLGD